MHISIAILALATLSTTVLAQSQSQSSSPKSLSSKEGYTTTRIFAPFSIGAGKQITALGSESSSTTWSVQDAMVSSLTLGPNTAINTFPMPAATIVNSTTWANATRIINCAVTPSSGSQSVTADCTNTMMYINPNVTSYAYATTTWPRPESEETQVPGYPAGQNGNVTAWDGMVDMYVTVTSGQVVTATDGEGKVVTSTQGAGVPMVTAMVQAVVVMAAGAAAMVV